MKTALSMDKQKIEESVELVKLGDYDIYPESTDSFYMKMFYYCQAETCRRRNQLCCISAIYLK